MKVIFFGTAHGYMEKNRFFTSTAVLVGEKCYLIDAGAPVASLLLNHNIEYKNVKGIFITHPHCDHYVGLADYIMASGKYEIYGGIRTDIYVPIKSYSLGYFSTLLRIKLAIFSRHHKYANKGVIYDDGTVKITAFPVKHCRGAHSFLLEAENKRIFFSGDLSDGMNDYPKFLFDNHVDVLVLEGAHTKLTDKIAINNLNASKIDRLYINHISPKMNPEEVISKAFSKINPSVKCTIAKDDMTFEL